MEKNYKKILKQIIRIILNGVNDRVKTERFKLIPGIGIEDTETFEIYVTLLEITHLLNQLNNRSKSR